jgi:hypothetical protein
LLLRERKINNRTSQIQNENVGLTGLEPVTLRLSSACSNQLSYRPGWAAKPPDLRFIDCRFSIWKKSRASAHFKNLKVAIAIGNSKWRQGDYAPASASNNVPFCWNLPPRPSGFGGKGIRTPDFQLAKLALYQLSYAPGRIFEFRLPICDCKEQNKMPDVDLANRHPALQSMCSKD